MRVLVTGGSGFVGGYVIAALQKAGCKVTGLSRSVPKRGWREEVPWIVGDLAEGLAYGGSFDAIVHTAGSSPHLGDTMQEHKRAIVDAMANLLRFAKEKGVSRLIYLSSISLYGEVAGGVLDEDSPIVNPGFYGIAKYVAERLLQEDGGVESLSLRLPGVFGRGANPIWLLRTIEKFRRGEDVEIYAPEFESNNLVWAKDLAEFICYLLGAPAWKYPVLTLGAAGKMTIGAMAEAVRRRTASPSRVIVRHSESRPFSISFERAREMGYRPRTIEEMLDEYFSETGGDYFDRRLR